LTVFELVLHTLSLELDLEKLVREVVFDLVVLKVLD
jgi:hypothetical protein